MIPSPEVGHRGGVLQWWWCSTVVAQMARWLAGCYGFSLMPM